MATKAFKVISVFSTPKKEFDPNNHLNFFLLDHENIVCNSVEAFADYVHVNFSAQAFRQRIIPVNKEVVTIPIGVVSSSNELVKFSEKEADTIELSETEPYYRRYDGIITDLYMYRYTDRYIHQSDTLSPNGLGIVSWAVRHSIPVGIVYDERCGDRQQNFFIESVLDTLQLHPCCNGPIFSGDIREVCYDMFHYLDGK